jgi:ketosteroid isomerase-like protein
MTLYLRTFIPMKENVCSKAESDLKRKGFMTKVLLGVMATLALFLSVNKFSLFKEQQSLVAQGEKWTQFYQTGNIDGLMSLYTDKAFVALHGQPALYGKQEIRSYFSSRVGKAELTFELDYEVRVPHDDIGYIISKYWLVSKSKQDGTVFRDAGRSLLVYVKEGGYWKIAADIDQMTPDVVWPSPGGLN